MPKLDPSVVDRGPPGQVRPQGSWNRRAWIKADPEFEQSKEPATSQVACRKAEFGRRAWRGRWVIRQFTWEWMCRKRGWMSPYGRAARVSPRPTINRR